jgi:chromosome segregation ATPase|tara:strand:- start:127 stop:360 length:234 start_codon:yes stop_codon:yes gene_type:complete
LAIDDGENLNYSEYMDEDINLLENKLNQLFDFITTLKEENADLKPSLQNAQQEIIVLKNKINDATLKMENLLAQLPK